MTRAEWNRRKGRSSRFVSRARRFAIYARDKFDCVYCRQVFPPDYTGKGLTLDHVIPRSKGGGDGADNLVTACAKCNASRQASKRCGAYGATPKAQKAARDRIRRSLKKPINLELGKWLSRMAAEQKRHEKEIEKFFFDPHSVAHSPGFE